MVADEQGLPIVAAVALRRADGRVLLVRHTDATHPGAAEGRWTLPAEPVADDEVVETALARLLQRRLHLSSDATEFSESVGLPGAIANVFTCTEWSGDPAYSADDYADAAWAAPHAPGGVDLPEGIRAYLASAFPAPQVAARGDTPQAPARGDTPQAPPARVVPAVAMPSTGAPKNLIRREAAPPAAPPLWQMTPGDLVAELEEAREALTAAYARFDEAWLDVTLDGDWAPVDLIHHCATVEAYYASEARRLAEEPGHTWRDFNPDQGAAERAGLGRPEDRRSACAPARDPRRHRGMDRGARQRSPRGLRQPRRARRGAYRGAHPADREPRPGTHRTTRGDARCDRSGRRRGGRVMRPHLERVTTRRAPCCC